MTARVELLSAEAVTPLAAHMLRNALESGRDGDAHARARSADDVPDSVALAVGWTVSWARELDVPGWERCFGLWFGDELRGHLDLRGGRISTELHRASLGIGIERPHRRAGWGRAMLDQAIAWSRSVGLAWLDLGVFTDNAPARALYRSRGFVEVGVTSDRFRIDGQSIDDLAMVLRL